MPCFEGIMYRILCAQSKSISSMCWAEERELVRRRSRLNGVVATPQQQLRTCLALLATM